MSLKDPIKIETKTYGPGPEREDGSQLLLKQEVRFTLNEEQAQEVVAYLRAERKRNPYYVFVCSTCDAQIGITREQVRCDKPYYERPCDPWWGKRCIHCEYQSREPVGELYLFDTSDEDLAWMAGLGYMAWMFKDWGLR